MLKTIATNQAPEAIGPYSQAKILNGVLYISGQIPVNPATNKILGTTIETQAEQVCKNIGSILSAAGSTFENVVKTTCYIDDMSHFAEFNSIYEKYFVSKPARACVAVKQLPKNVMCEIEVIAESENR